MKVKSFDIGLIQGVGAAIEQLDKYVAALGDVEIHQLTDTLYPKIDFTEHPIDGNPCLVRVVVYEQRAK